MPNGSTPDFWGDLSPGDGDLDAWLAGNPSAAPRGVDDVLQALRAEPSHAELIGQARAIAEFRRVYRRPRHHRRVRELPVMWVATAAALVAVAVGGAATVTGRIPLPIQNIARVVFAGHPAPTPSPHPTPVRSVRRSAEAPASSTPSTTAPGQTDTQRRSRRTDRDRRDCYGYWQWQWHQHRSPVGHGCSNW